MVARDFEREPGMRMDWKPGAVGGIIAGLVFAMFEMVMAAIMQGMEAFFMPLRMIGGIALGPEALDPSYPLLNAGLAGLMVHMVLSVVYGVVFAVLLNQMPQMRSSTGAAAVAGFVFGLLLWVVNFFVVAPMFGWTWFPQETNPVVQIVAHGLFFGSVLALYLVRAMGSRRLAP